MSETSILCICTDCKRDFESYDWSTDCSSCDGEGEYEMEMEWEYTPSLHTCPFCKGHGHFKYVEGKRCKSCKTYAEQCEPEEYYDDGY